MALTTAIIGLGNMGRRHAMALLKDPRVELLWGVTRSEQSARAAQGELGIPAGTDAARLLAERPPRLVVVAAPTAEHARWSLAALEAGAAVLVEKPLAANREEAARLLGAPGFLQAAHCMAYDPAVTAARSELVSGTLGAIRSLTLTRRGPAMQGPREPGTRPEKPWVYEQLIHLTSIIHTLAGEPIATLDAAGVLDLRRHAERVLRSGTLRSGADVRLDVSPEGDQQLLQVRVEAERGSLSVTLGRDAGVIREASGTRRELPLRRGNLFDLQARDVVERVLSGQPPLESAERGLWAMDAAERMMEG